MTDICHYVHERIEPQLRLNSHLSSLKAPEGWYQGQWCVESFTNVVFILGDQPFASHSCHAIAGNVCNRHVNKSTGARYQWRAVLFSDESSDSKRISFGESLELLFILDTSVKEMRTDQSVSVFGWYLSVDAQTSMSIPVKILMLTSSEMLSWMLMCALIDAFMIQDENARPHRVHIVDAYLEQESIQGMQ
ncbi:hypothetical protein TNCV_1600181 [Trichonephila clavipes]|nr:hypothetical protein TNCV_1600181 [Trichonephila clavipes]